ncbi:MAG TPA: CDGSH iron-sulfur domain-containing protein [Caldithrix abyssi]|uniref:CDGSH iron-sulfur domain-containing protein n=1 Tax=Caldithrix abyssi TaxID=187145 RepID=A0A7V1PVP6_CALAY|nr:CDGSH iron-sulfur domain-containing protein [Caldithrix abyssi]
MGKAYIAQKAPFAIEAQEGQKYAWCSCGLSVKQPFCDGSHKGTAFKPITGKYEKSGTVWLCGCKQTGNAPFCDGSHKELKD